MHRKTREPTDFAEARMLLKYKALLLTSVHVLEMTYTLKLIETNLRASR